MKSKKKTKEKKVSRKPKTVGDIIKDGMEKGRPIDEIAKDIAKKIKREQAKVQRVIENSKFDGDELFFEAVIRVYGHDMFWGRILSNVRKYASDKVPTMGVWFNAANRVFELLYNPDFLVYAREMMSEADFNEFASVVVKHEAAHIIWGHVTTRSYEELYDPQWRNICFDVVVNHSVGMREVWKDKKGEEFFTPCSAKMYKWPNGESTEFYLSLREEMEKMMQGGCGQGDGEGEGEGQGGMKGDVVDDHGSFGNSGKGKGKEGDGKEGDGSASAEDLANHEIYRMVKDAMDEVQRGRGTVPAGMEARIRAVLGGIVNWKKIFKRLLFEAYQRTMEKEATRMRRNRRYGLMHPGYRCLRQGTPPILVALDVSGSVADEEIAEYIGEINSLIKTMDAVVDIASFDTKMGKIVRKARKITALDVVGRGGTDYDDVIRKYNENKKNRMLVVFTDGFCPPPSVSTNKPVFWFVWGKNSNKDFQVNASKQKVFVME